jgi:hypothetical protein
MCATVGTPFVDKILRLVASRYVLHDAAYSQRILSYSFFLSLANSVEWHVAGDNMVGHLKHIVTVCRKACCRLQL